MTVLLGLQCPSRFLYDIFGVYSLSELEDSQTLPAYVPTEGERAELLTALIEQIRYDRTDGSSLPIRVMSLGSSQAKSFLGKTLIEESPN